MNLAIRSAIESAQASDSGSARPKFPFPRLYRWATIRFVIPKMRKGSMQAADACAKLKLSVMEVERNTDDELIDEDLRTRETLEILKGTLRESLNDLRKTERSLQEVNCPVPELAQQLEIMKAIIQELHSEANRLQWAIAEHDATYAKRLNGFVANNADELSKMLDRMASH